jgi:hypothetical protein
VRAPQPSLLYPLPFTVIADAMLLLFPQTDGGYLGSDFETFFSAVVTGAAGAYIGTLVEEPGIRTDLTVTPGQRVSVSGDRSLMQTPPSWGFGGFAVQERGLLSLTYLTVLADMSVQEGGDLTLQYALVSGNIDVAGGILTAQGSSLGGTITILDGGTASVTRCTLDARVRLVVTGGSLSLASMAVPASVLAEAESCLRVRELRLSAVTVPEHAEWGELTGAMTVDAGGRYAKKIDPPNFGAAGGAGAFGASSGACAVSAPGGR